ncbi:MAG: PEP-CTERM sorting domain-containing protein [Verrucomicrobia bacterium]|nr:PEP-CTERM sorting domain-containing protein [Verrucomicrobiota bacterium]MCH8514379.1 PEP-CTERM sorting domain-containing protein [Kiritimatiellia bacterium]
MRCFYFRLLLLISLSVPVLHGALVRVGTDAGGFNFDPSEKYVILPFAFENNDQGTQYVEFQANLFRPLFEQIHLFGNNSSEYATLDDMLQGNHYLTDRKNFYIGLDDTASYVSSGWTASLNPNGGMSVFEEFPGFDIAETWTNSVDSNENHTARGMIQIYAGLLSNTGDSGDYVFGDLSTGMQMAMSANTFFEDFGEPAGTTQVGTVLVEADARYVTAIPEPGSLVLVGVGLLAGIAALRRR